MAGVLKGLFSDRNKTFKPLKTHSKDSKRHKLSEYAKATLGSGNMRSAVVLPKGEDLNEWLAVNSKFMHLRGIHGATSALFFQPLTFSTRSAYCMVL